MITKDQRKKLLKILPKNYREILAAEFDVHPQTIGNVLYARTPNNKKIEIAIMVLAIKTKEAADREEEKKNRIMTQLSEAKV